MTNSPRISRRIRPVCNPLCLPHGFGVKVTMPPSGSVSIFSRSLNFVTVIRGNGLSNFGITVNNKVNFSRKSGTACPRLSGIVNFIAPSGVCRITRGIVAVRHSCNGHSIQGGTHFGCAMSHLNLRAIVMRLRGHLN